MHRLWDSDMIEPASKDEDFWLDALAALDTKGNRQEAMKGTVEEWATESLLAARQAYRVPETGKRLKPGRKLGDAYVDANCMWCANGSTEAGFGWRWCSMRRSRRTDERFSQWNAPRHALRDLQKNGVWLDRQASSSALHPENELGSHPIQRLRDGNEHQK